MDMYKDRDQYGGWNGLQFGGTGFFRLEDTDRRWWLVTPAGNAFLSFGINHVEPGLLRNPYNKEHWMREFGLDETSGDQQFLDRFYDKVRQDLRSGGLNTLGCHNPNHIYDSLRVPYVFTTRFVDICHYMTPEEEGFIDVWSSEFEAHCDEEARQRVAPRKEDPYLLGYAMIDCPIWSDLDAAPREVTVYGNKRPGLTTWPRRLRNLGPESQGKQAYVETMRELYDGNIGRFNATYQSSFASFDDLAATSKWRLEVDPDNGRELFDNTVFLNRTVDRYYQVAVGAIRHHDPNHLVLGDKLNGNTDVSDDLIRIVAKHCDLLFYQYYAIWEDQKRLLDRLARTTGKAILCGDASISVPDENMPVPLGPQFRDQHERAEVFRELIRNCYSRTDFVGWNWCGWVDRWEVVQPGRQHSGVQDPLGNHYPIVESMRNFSAEMYEIASPKTVN
ncbi:hypothetical protein ACFL6S_29350 [Candidatus Poribacteria bacterium]